MSKPTHLAQAINATLDAWQRRAKTLGLKPNGTRYFKARLEFLVGANSLWIALDPEKHRDWPVTIMAAVARPTNALYLQVPEQPVGG